MKENISRSDLRIFFHVSKAGSLNMDAKTLLKDLAIVSRRILHLKPKIKDLIFFKIAKNFCSAKTICHGGGMSKAVCAAKGERHDQLNQLLGSVPILQLF